MKHILMLIILLVLPVVPTFALTIGTTENSPPLASLADQKQHYFGFEIDIMQAICTRIKIHCHFKPVIVNNIVNQLMAQKIDVAIAAIIIPPRRMSGFLFSIPYLASNTQFIVEKSSDIHTPTDIQNKRIGVRLGTLAGGKLFENFVLKLYKNKVHVREYPTTNDLMAALHNKDVDIVFTNSVIADYWLLNNTDQYRLVGTKIPIGNGYGIMANQGQEILIGKINQALLSMMADGSYLAIYSRYF